MRSEIATPTGGRGSRAIGVVSGFVLKLSRQTAGLTQEKLAEVFGVDVTTVQGWESGRRPLAAMGAGEFLRLGARLTRLGAPSSTGRHLSDAVEADLVLSTAISAGAAWVDPDVHPLAGKVHRKAITNLITWPFTGSTPPQLRDFVSKVPRRGPVACRPVVRRDERSSFFDHLLLVAERAGSAGEPLLRRQAVYLLGFDRREQVVDWLRGEWRRAGRRTLVEGDIPGLLEARSASVALASTGAGEHIHDFVAGMAGGWDELANLNYWAYWTGELGDAEVDDSFMLNSDTRSWAGTSLLSHLVNRLDPVSPQLPLNLYTLHTLVASRSTLLSSRPDVRTSLAEALEKLTSTDSLSRVGRDQAAGLHYALRISDH